MERHLEEFQETNLGKADIVCFQEIKEINGTPQAQYIAEQLGYPYYFQPGSNAIISKYPIIATGEVQLQPDSGRASPFADININGKVVRVHGPHLSFKKGKNFFISKYRGKQMRSILNHVNQFDGPSIIAGDINTVGRLWFGGHKREKAIKYAFKAGFVDALEDVLKWPRHSTQWIGKIDWILSRDLKVGEGERGRYAGSDHRWIMSEFDFQ